MLDADDKNLARHEPADGIGDLVDGVVSAANLPLTWDMAAHPGKPINVQTDFCLCGSGKLIIDCCFARISVKIPAQPAPYSHPKCYARDLGSCSTRISGEHYVSASIMKLIGPGGLHSSWHGKKLPIDAFRAKMLCKAHNEALAGLDAAAERLFSFIFAPWEESESSIHLIRGHDIERWLLKMLIGVVAGKVGPAADDRRADWKPQRSWLEILFGEKEIEAPCGLRIFTGKYIAQTKAFQFNVPQDKETGEPTFCAFEIGGIMLGLDVSGEFDDDRLKLSESHFRPAFYQLHQGRAYREVDFGWPNGPSIFTKIEITSGLSDGKSVSPNKPCVHVRFRF